MFNFKNQRILIIAPHPDDEIFGCGGLIHRCKNEGGKVYILYLTVGTTKDFSKKGISTMEERRREIEKVARFMKYDGYRIAFPGNEYHLRLDALPQKDIIDEIERGEEISLETIQPTIVAAPMPHDYNQDHRAACTALITATRPTPSRFKKLPKIILQYELPPSVWSDGTEAPTMDFFVNLEKENLATKRKAIELYKSQIKGPDVPLSPYGITTLAQLRGIQCGMTYAEAYQLKRLIA